MQLSMSPIDTIREIVKQMNGIGGSRSVGFGQNRISSVPDAVAKVLSEEFGLTVKINGTTKVELKEEAKSEVEQNLPLANADMCPECGNHTFVKEEGCQKCYNCGYSVC
jgi:ribonucleoside-diphosphate reductase alpha chain